MSLDNEMRRTVSALRAMYPTKHVCLWSVSALNVFCLFPAFPPFLPFRRMSIMFRAFASVLKMSTPDHITFLRAVVSKYCIRLFLRCLSLQIFRYSCHVFMRPRCFLPIAPELPVGLPPLSAWWLAGLGQRAEQGALRVSMGGPVQPGARPSDGAGLPR